jgi:GNAT superfamily N-acetyltransferase
MKAETAATDIAIRALGAAEAEARLGELADVLVDAVAGGAGVNFMAGFTAEEGRAYWRSQLPAIASGQTLLFVAETATAGSAHALARNAARIVGTVLLVLAWQPNAPHRAEIGKMLVHSTMRRHGLGRRLLTAAEDAARKAGRTLLLLDTVADSAGDRLYRNCGWTPFGIVPGHAHLPHGPLADTTFFYKRLANA